MHERARLCKATPAHFDTQLPVRTLLSTLSRTFNIYLARHKLDSGMPFVSAGAGEEGEGDEDEETVSEDTQTANDSEATEDEAPRSRSTRKRQRKS